MWAFVDSGGDMENVPIIYPLCKAISSGGGGVYVR